MIQSRDLVMVALGSQGQPQRWFGPPMEEGVHLRWTFRSELGYPFSGFGLSRRPHVAGTLVDVALPSAPTALIPLPAVARRVTAEFEHPFWFAFLSPPKPLPGAVGLFEDVESSTSSVAMARTRVTVSVEGDALTAVRLTTPGRWRLRRLRYVPVSQDQDTGWDRLRPICLPVTDPKYPCHPGPVNAGADRDEARSRIAAQDGQLDTEMVDQYLELLDWQEFHHRARTLFDPPIPASLALSSAIDSEAPSVGTSTVDLALLASVDPYVARILGLYWIDRTAQPGQPYDYKLVGKWLKSQLKAPETTLDFEHDKLGRRHAQTFLREGVIVRSFHKGSVEAVTGTPWKDTRCALDLKPFTPTGMPNSPAYLRVQFQESVAEVQLYLRMHQGEPQLATSIPNITVSKWKSPDGGFMILTAAATNATERIEFVTLDPIAGSAGLHLALCKVGILRDWSAPLSEERAWITYNVRTGTPPAMSAPTGLFVEPLQTPARELPNGIVAAAPRAGLRWHVPAATVLLPGEPIRYLIERQPLGTGDAAAPIVASEWKAVNLDAPVGIPDAEDGASHFYFDDPSAASGSADRFYAYRVAGIDIFGRLSPRSAPFVADLRDSQAPPPPADVEATYRQSDASLTVRWNWSPGQRVQAPDAREFRIYAQRGRLNTMTGRITAVAANTDGTFTVTTDGSLESGAANAFAGDWLLNGGVYFTVLHNTTGQDFQLTVRAPSAPPPARPAPGPFTLSIRPPRPLAGTVTKARKHLFGEVTLRTDQRTNLGADALAGKWFRQGGRDFRILSNTSGDTFRLSVTGLGLPARVPGKGKFAVVEQDGTTPFLADPGNVLHRDYLRPENWAERRRVETVASPVAGQITAVSVDNASGTSTVTTDQPLNDPQHRFARGMLGNNGQVFRVLAHDEGPPLALTVANIAEDDEPIIAPASGEFEYHMGYEVTFPFDLAPSAGDGVAYAQVAVSTADDKDHVPDSPHWNATPLGGRPGNEGAVSSPVLVQKPLGTAWDERPDAPDVGDGVATAADYYGRSFIDVRWQHQDGMRVEVYRALDEAIFAADRAARPGRSTDRSAYPWLSDEEFAQVVEQQPEYGAMPDELVRILAGLPGNEAAFGLVVPAPLDVGSYLATIHASANRHCFAQRLVDVAGGRSALSWPSHTVRASRGPAPWPPLITGVAGADRQIALTWRTRGQPTVNEYRIYRSDGAEAARDTRLMTLVHTAFAPFDPPGELTWIDHTVSGLVIYSYRVVAVDAAGISSASVAVEGRAFDDIEPLPPVPTVAWLDTGNGQLRPRITWGSGEETLLQHRGENGGPWLSLTGWLSAGEHDHVDQESNPSGPHEYRVWARKPNGLVAIGDSAPL